MKGDTKHKSQPITAVFVEIDRLPKYVIDNIVRTKKIFPNLPITLILSGKNKFDIYDLRNLLHGINVIQREIRRSTILELETLSRFRN